MPTTETWRPIPGYPGYEASDRGRIRSLVRNWRDGPRLVAMKVHQFTGIGKQGTKHRRPEVSMWADGRQRTHSVGHAVCLAFHGPRPVGLECCHVDGDPFNNRPSNLRWGTKSENAHDTVRHGHHNRQQIGA